MKMLELSVEKMEVVEGGGRVADCIGFGLGVIGLGIAIASVPATGPVGVATVIGIWSGAIGTGISMAGCI